MKLSGVMIGSENPKALAEFYEKFLGEPGWKEDVWFGFDIGGGWVMMGPHSEVKGTNKEPGRIMLSIDSDDVKADFEKIKATGAKVVAEPYNPSSEDKKFWLATFADLDGNYFQLATPWKA